MLERKVLENVVKISRLFDKRITGRMFFCMHHGFIT